MDIENKKSLHEIRYEEAKRRAFDNKFKIASQEAKSSISINGKNDFFGTNNDTKGKTIKFKPNVFYNAQDALSDCMKKFKDQASENIRLIKESREAKGQKLTTKADLKDVLGEYHEGRRPVKIGPVTTVVFHVYIKEWCGAICVFELSEANYGAREMKRRGYVVEKVSVVYYQKNGVGMSKELILKQPFASIPKHPEKTKEKTDNEDKKE